MNGTIAVIIFIVGVAIAGIIVYVGRKQFFNLPEIKTEVYGINLYYKKETEMEGFKDIDMAMSYLLVFFNKEYPGITREKIKEKFNILKVYVMDDYNDSLYIKDPEVKFGDDIPKEQKYIIKDDGIYFMVNGVQKSNFIFVRKLGNHFIKDTAFVHEVVHYLLECFIPESKSDPKHVNKLYWENPEGFVGKVLDKFNNK